MSASRNLLLATGAVAALGVGWTAAAPPDESELVFFSVGQGDSTLFRHRDAAILIDTGPSESTAGINLLPKLRRLGVSRLDLIVLTHPDQDHIGGTGTLLRRFRGARLATSAEFRNHPQLLEKLVEWRVRPEDVVWLPRSQTGRIGPYALRFYCPDIQDASQDNDGSVMLRIEGQGVRAVLSGDASAESEVLAAASGDWCAQILKAGHHGSRTSSSWPWLREVKPRVAVVSCGRNNAYGHPHDQVLERFASVGARVLRTDQLGDIRLRIGAHGFALASPDRTP